MQLRTAIFILGVAALLSACNGNAGSGSTTSAEDSLKALQPDTSAASRDTAYMAEVPQPEDSIQAPPDAPSDAKATGAENGKSNERKKGEVPEPSVYRFTVSFYSPGNGIDHAVKGKFDTFVGEFGKRHKVKLQHETVTWGREGEVDYCFPLTELKAIDQAAFVKEGLAILKASERVNTKENTTCRQPRK
jgi:hypothetical protein